jgi:hypothetical protein
MRGRVWRRRSCGAAGRGPGPVAAWHGDHRVFTLATPPNPANSASSTARRPQPPSQGRKSSQRAAKGPYLGRRGRKSGNCVPSRGALGHFRPAAVPGRMKRMNTRFLRPASSGNAAPGCLHDDTIGDRDSIPLGPACCCPARPAVRVVMPATAARPHQTELLLRSPLPRLVPSAGRDGRHGRRATGDPRRRGGGAAARSSRPVTPRAARPATNTRDLRLMHLGSWPLPAVVEPVDRDAGSVSRGSEA